MRFDSSFRDPSPLRRKPFCFCCSPQSGDAPVIQPAHNGGIPHHPVSFLLNRTAVFLDKRKSYQLSRELVISSNREQTVEVIGSQWKVALLAHLINVFL